MKRRKLLAGIGGAALGGSILMGSGAFSSVDANRGMSVAVVEDPDAYLRLAKCKDSPNGAYVDLDDGLMTIDLSDSNDNVPGDGVNANAITEINNVFEICNQGTQVVCISLEFDPEVNGNGDDAVRIFREPDYVQVGPERDDGAFLLEPGECVCFSLLIDTHGISPGDNIADNLMKEVTDDGEELQIIAAAEDSHIYETPPCFDDPGFPSQEQKIYLTNSVPRDDSGDEISGTQLLSVEALDSGSGEAILNNLGFLDAPDFDQVDSMAVRPDGGVLYFYDKDTAAFGKWETPVAQNSLTDLGSISGDPGGVVLGDFIPGDNGYRLLVVSADDDKLYEVEDYDTTPSLTELGDTEVDVQGSDIEWVSGEEQLYLHTNNENDPDLYKVNDIDSGVTTDGARDIGEDLTGLALGETGSPLIGSVSGGSGGSEPGEIIRFDVSGSGTPERFDMTLDGDDYNYSYGDMGSWTD